MTTTSTLTPSAEVLAVLARRGFRRTDAGDHAVLEREDIRLVLPGADRDLPADFLRRLEYALEAILGEGWLTEEPVPEPERSLGEIVTVGDRRLFVVDAFATQSSDSAPWCAFLPDELSVMGFGDTREGALRDLKVATALWLGVDTTDVVFITPTGL
ncbi:MAG: hypothetical protein KGR18_03435 [Acidobacteria bacterium]|nr:hypothetical protein [Acidobacteriota bacterium]